MSVRTQRGVPPFGQRTLLRVFVDPDLLRYESSNGCVWAAAGMGNDVFAVVPHKLVEASGGSVAYPKGN